MFGSIVHHTVLDPRDGRTVLCAARTGHLGPVVMRSTDAGRTWTQAPSGPSFPKGEARISGGTEVATLLGQPAPTYNLIAAAQGSLFPSPAWTLRGSATALQALLINSYYLQSGLYCTAVTALATGQAQLEWRPVPWFRGQAGYSVSLNSTRDQAGCEAYIPVSTDGNEAPYQRYDQVIYHTVTLTASFSLEGGLSSRPSRQVSRP